MSKVLTGIFAGGFAVAMTAAAMTVLAWPAQAGQEIWIWPQDVPPAHEYHGGGHGDRHGGHPPHASHDLNGTLALGGLSGGVGNTYGSLCCSGGGGVTYRGARRQGGDGDIAFRAARDGAFGPSFGGPASDRAFRFRANSIQRSGF